LAEVEGQAEQEPKEASPRPLKKKRKSRWFGLLLVFLLVLGVLFGLHASGVADLRPIIYTTVPRIPVLGGRLGKLLSVPERYALTAVERRRLELEEYEKSVMDKLKELEAQRAAIEAASQDLAAREARLRERELALQEAAQRASGSQGSAASSNDGSFEELVQIFQEINPRRGSEILTRLPKELAVRVLKALPQDQAASLLGRMDAAKAAELTEQLVKEGP
jgi:flagellar motility protein MotE (MotC chaperone)